MNRINYLDGHRGIAILLVMMFHAFSRYPDLVPYGNNFADFPPFKFGYLGVQLFFLISGFVILMTLEKCKDIKEFIYRRWLRLFPTMLVCSIIIFSSIGFFSERPHGQQDVKDLLPGLTFIEPYIWEKFTGIPFRSIEGTFWSLYVEFKFYVISALLYFFIGSRKLVVTLLLCFLSWFVLEQLHQLISNPVISRLHSITDLLSFQHFGWFSSGASYYIYVKSQNKNWFYFAVFVSFISSVIISRLNVEALSAAILISLFFTSSIISIKVQQIISNKLFLFMGFVSYPLYLLHENMMVSIIIKLNSYLYFIPSLLFPIIAITLISLIAYFVANYLEVPMRKKISTALSKTSIILQSILSDKRLKND